MKVTSIQPEMKDRSKPENLAYILSIVDACPQSDLILLPEIWPSGYFCFDRYRAEGESIDGPILATFRQKAVEKECHMLMGSLEVGGEIFGPLTYAFRPPHTPHGPFASKDGCLFLEIHYFDSLN